jgi:hypothetical protein
MSGLLLAVHSYHGGNAACARHWPFFARSGASKIVGVGTDDGMTVFPPGVVQWKIGPNRYIDGAHLPTRLLLTLQNMLDDTGNFSHLAIAEYDTLILGSLPLGPGMASHKAVGPLGRVKAGYHNPWLFDRESAARFIHEGHRALLELRRGDTECSPDMFFGWVTERMGATVDEHRWTEFSRNTIDETTEDRLGGRTTLAAARDLYLNGDVDVLHGIKTERALEVIFERPCTLQDAYDFACRPSDISEHMPTLMRLAIQCDHVTEMGVRSGASTAAFLAAQPKRLVSYDINKFTRYEALCRLVPDTDFTFVQADVLKATIEHTDMLFIDTLHTYGQLSEELLRHSDKVRKFIVMHDTTTYGEHGEIPGSQGLWLAVQEFMIRHNRWVIRTHYKNNNGLTVLERV